MTEPKLSASRIDIHQTITDQIVAAIEAGAPTFTMPWHRSRGLLMRPVNIESSKGYRGINTLSLWIAAEVRGYTAPLWGTYRQWQAKGAQVRKGEKASLIVFYKELEYAREAEGQAGGSDEEGVDRVRFARASWVFNCAQVEGFELPQPDHVPAVTFDPLEAAEQLMKLSRADIREGGDRAFYDPAGDFVALPDRHRFKGSETMTPQEAFYATGLHELVHWSGGKARLARDLSGRFGTESYAMEELCAELGASYLCTDLGVTTELRPDHAAYIANWLKVLKSDKKAIFTAAAAAERASAYLSSFLGGPQPLPSDSPIQDEPNSGSPMTSEAGPEPRPQRPSPDDGPSGTGPGRPPHTSRAAGRAL
jgi:antirestriction protein ArdC